MKKVNLKRVDKIWGYEKWIYSPVKGNETDVEGVKTTTGPLIKILKAEKNLSVQVHPDDKLAKELENEENGKSESWYVIDAEKDAKLIIGLKDYNGDNIRQMIKEGTFEDNLIKIPAKHGDFINVPAGIVHGIGAGLKVLEVQQPSDTTYRYYDYNRLQDGKPRELHIEKAIRSQKELSYKLEPTNSFHKTYVNKVGSQSYRTESSILEEDSIVVDIDNEIAYVASKGEEVNFKNYCVISY